MKPSGSEGELPTVSRSPTVTAVSAHPATTVFDYVPERPGGEPRSGACWTNSSAIPSRLAWRCDVGSQVLDPCFALGNGEVTCNPNPLTGSEGLLVKLTKPLPAPDVIIEAASRPWLLRLEDGLICSLATGATGLVEDKRISYLCASAGTRDDERGVILGDPTPGPVWTAERAMLSLRDGKHVTGSLSIVAVQTVVRGPAVFVPFDCSGLVQAIGDVLGVEPQWAEAPFLDYVLGERGTGCRVSASGPHVGSSLELTRRMLRLFGWQEDARYKSQAAELTSSAFRKANALCLFSAGPATATETTTPLSRVAGESQARRDGSPSAITLSCAQDRTSPPAPEPGPPAPYRILFEPGEIVGSLQRTIASAEIQEYVLWAFAGQTMHLQVASPAGDVFLTVAGRDGARLVTPSANARDWHGELPATQDYLIRVVARGEATQFTMTVTIPPSEPSAGK